MLLTLPTDLTPPIVQKKTNIHANNRQRTRSHFMACVSTSMPSDSARTSCLHHRQIHVIYLYCTTLLF